jgi:hypothetical protein
MHRTSLMANKPKILFRLLEDGNKVLAPVSAIGLHYQLTLADMGGERHCRLDWSAEFDEIGLLGEWALFLNMEAAENLAAKLQQFIDANRRTQEDYN